MLLLRGVCFQGLQSQAPCLRTPMSQLGTTVLSPFLQQRVVGRAPVEAESPLKVTPQPAASHYLLQPLFLASHEHRNQRGNSSGCLCSAQGTAVMKQETQTRCGGSRRRGGRMIWLVLPPLSLNQEQKPIRTPSQPSDNVIFFCCSGDQTFKRKRKQATDELEK